MNKYKVRTADGQIQSIEADSIKLLGDKRIVFKKQTRKDHDTSVFEFVAMFDNPASVEKMEAE